MKNFLYRHRWFLLAAAAASALLGVSSLSQLGVAAPAAAVTRTVAAAPSTDTLHEEAVAEWIYDGGLKGGWQDWGWAPRDVMMGRPARLDCSNFGGWILAHRHLAGQFGALTFRLRAPAYSDFLEVRLSHADHDDFTPIRVTKQYKTAQLADDWQQFTIGMEKLNPEQQSFDKVIVRAAQPLQNTWIELDKVALLASPPAPPTHAGAAPQVGPTAPRPTDVRRVALQIDCTRTPQPIHPRIYGVAYNARRNAAQTHQWDLQAAARRWGGNATSRFNWKLGNAWNTASDWFYMNVNFTGNPQFSWRDFLDESAAHGQPVALTLPLLGWVAKDTNSYSFPVQLFGPQQATADSNADIGNGVRPDGQEISPHLPPERTSLAAPPAFIAEWVHTIREYDASKNRRSVDIYILDNEPGLWNSTHRDVHPQPTTYDELLERTLAYGAAVRNADPDAMIAGPAAWGWVEYFYSAKDHAAGLDKRPDRRAHGDEPLLAWYLKQLRAHEKATGQRLLNLLDVHFYPQGKGIFGHRESNDRDTAARRIRSTRALWDPTYRDESWIDDTIRLIPRMRSLITENYPGLGLAIGEYNFGGENHMSGALALAEALGRFGQLGVEAAYYWTLPPARSPAARAFQAYRNYDSQGARFLDYAVPATANRDTSLFASTDAERRKIVAIALNFDERQWADANVFLTGCGALTNHRIFRVTDGSGIASVNAALQLDELGAFSHTLPPYSITVFELEMTPPPITSTRSTLRER